MRYVRYNSSCITANITDPGLKFKNVPDVSAIYISEFDVFKSLRTIYYVEPTIIETNVTVDNGLHEIYVNTAINDGTEISEIMQCFLQTEVNNKKFPKLSKRVYYFKHEDEGINDMCTISEEFREEGRLEEREEAISKMLEKLSPEEIIELGYKRDFVMQIAEQKATYSVE